MVPAARGQALCCPGTEAFERCIAEVIARGWPLPSAACSSCPRQGICWSFNPARKAPAAIVTEVATSTSAALQRRSCFRRLMRSRLLVFPPSFNEMDHGRGRRSTPALQAASCFQWDKIPDPASPTVRTFIFENDAAHDGARAVA